MGTMENVATVHGTRLVSFDATDKAAFKQESLKDCRESDPCDSVGAIALRKQLRRARGIERKTHDTRIRVYFLQKENLFSEK